MADSLSPQELLELNELEEMEQLEAEFGSAELAPKGVAEDLLGAQHALRRGLLQSLGLGNVPEVQAGVGSILSGKPFAEELSGARGQQEALEKEYPISSGVGEGLGIVGTAAPLARGVQAAGKGIAGLSGLSPKIAQYIAGIGAGAGMSGASSPGGAVNPEDPMQLEERAQQAGVGAGVGSVAPIAGRVVAAGRKVTDPIGKFLGGKREAIEAMGSRRLGQRVRQESTQALATAERNLPKVKGAKKVKLPRDLRELQSRIQKSPIAAFQSARPGTDMGEKLAKLDRMSGSKGRLLKTAEEVQFAHTVAPRVIGLAHPLQRAQELVKGGLREGTRLGPGIVRGGEAVEQALGPKAVPSLAETLQALVRKRDSNE